MLDIADFIVNNHDQVLYVIAGLSFVVELTVIGLSGPLIFFGLGCVSTGVLVSLGLVSSWEMECLLVGVFSIVSALVLWKPLKKFQGADKNVKDNSSDMIGQIVPVSKEVTLNGGNIRHSGIDWSARLDDGAGSDALAEGTRVEITGVDGNVIIVKARDV
ncbi:MAG: acriflavin resistance protein [Gammaproteobacteria bacterium]|nr:MAG: acriflavin resistance protein [Gammaproteobacteria bacterium]